MKENLIFRDERLNKQFFQKGYLVIPIFPSDTIKELKNFYDSTPHSFKTGFHTTHFITDKEYKRQVNDFIINNTKRYLQPIFNAFRPVFANFMIKEPGNESYMPLHADWAYVNEDLYTSIAIWIPLIDTNNKNGSLCIIPFSDRLSDNIRGPKITQWASPCDKDLILKYGKSLPLCAGEAVIYNHRLLHYSPPNLSNSVRSAVNISMIPESAPMLHYSIPEGTNCIHKFAFSDSNFFLDYENFQMPQTGEITERIDPSAVPLLNEKIKAFDDWYPKSNFNSIMSLNLFRKGIKKFLNS